jgi:hypothetical protein
MPMTHVELREVSEVGAYDTEYRIYINGAPAEGNAVWRIPYEQDDLQPITTILTLLQERGLLTYSVVYK